MFELVSKYIPNGDQPQAIEKLVSGIKNGEKHQVLLGATGTGKTFTIANVIKEVNRALHIKVKTKSYINEVFSWNETPYDLLAISYYNIGNYVLAYKYSTLALKENPHDKRLKNNKAIIREKLKNI